MAVWVERNNILYPALYLSPHSVQFLVFSFFLTVMQISGASALALAYATSVCGIYMHVLSCCFRLNMNEGQIQLLGSQRKHSVSVESTWFFLHLILSFISWIFLDIFIKRCANLKSTYGHLFQVFRVTLLSQTKFPLEMIKTFHAAARGIDPQYPSLFRGKELDESPSALPQPLFMASCRRCENIIISWWARAKTA